MFYVDNEMIKGGLVLNIRSSKQLSDFLKSILIDSVEIAKPTKVNGDFLIFNDGYKINTGLSLVEINDGTKSINVNLKQIDINTVQSDKDLSEFSAKDIVLKTPVVSGWRYEENDEFYIFSNSGSNFKISKKTALTVFAERGATSLTGSSYASVEGELFFIYSENGFLLKYKYSASAYGVWGFFVNESSTNFLPYNENTSFNNINVSIKTIDGISAKTINNDYLSKGQFSNNGGPLIFFPLTAGGHKLDFFLNVSGNLKNNFGNEKSVHLLNADEEKVILLIQSGLFIGMSYDYTVL
ncbi:MAG: hypothetical protein ACRCXK_02005 [Wohlfahrtiimonas sp.]